MLDRWVNPDMPGHQQEAGKEYTGLGMQFTCSSSTKEQILTQNSSTKVQILTQKCMGAVVLAKPPAALAHAPLKLLTYADVC